MVIVLTGGQGILAEIVRIADPAGRT